MDSPRDTSGRAGSPGRVGNRVPLNVAILCSRRAPGLSYLLDHDPNRGVLYDVAACLTSEDSFAEADLAVARGVPVLVHPIRRFCREGGWRLADPEGRAAYDADTVARLTGHQIDVVVLASYLYVLSKPMLSSFRDRIVNVHHSDLTLRDRAGRARLTGLHAVRDAICAGERDTRATVHLVTKDLDQGPAFLQSWLFPVGPLARTALTWQATDILKAYAYAHQEWMIRTTWGPLIGGTLELIATGRLDLAGLARAAASDLGAPWELVEGGAILGAGPLRSIPSTHLVARVS